MTRFQKKKLTHATFLVVITVILSVAAVLSDLADVYERKTIDIRTRLCRMDTVLPEDIVIILIDESSLQAMNDVAGRWPWPRYIHAELIDYLAMCGAESVIMDIMFFENQIGSEAPEGELDPNDFRLAESTGEAGNVYHAVELSADVADEVNKNLLDIPMPEDFISKFSLNVTSDIGSMGNNIFYLPFKELYQASAGVGVVSFSSDDDAVHRSEKLLFEYQGNYYPSHAFAPVLKRFGYATVHLKQGRVVITSKDAPDFSIPLSKNHEYYANMYGNYHTFSYSGVIESLIKVQQGITDELMVPPEEFSGKIVFIGASAAATYDLKNTSIGTNVPGVFLHASICGNILGNDFLIFRGHLMNLVTLVIALIIIVFCILFMKKIVYQIYLPIGIILLHLASSVILFEYNIVIYVAVPVSAMIFAYFASFTYISFTEGKEKRKVKNILGQYVAPAMLATVLENSKEEYLKAEIGSKENLTVFFSDIRGFTSISEKYPVESVVEVLNDYLSLMVDIIFENSGTLDKFIGDAVVAFWGAPVKFDDHHYKAVLSAIRMIESLEEFNKSNKEKNLPEIQIGIGIHTDDVILGNIGSRKKLDYTVIGDGVNLTSRLESLTKNYHSSILISDTTHDHIKGRICCRVADYVKVKGKEEPILIYQVIGRNGSVSPDHRRVAELSDKGFGAYRQQQFEEALKHYESVLSINPDDNLIRLFMDRCREFIKNRPGDDWDGCYVHTTK